MIQRQKLIPLLASITVLIIVAVPVVGQTSSAQRAQPALLAMAEAQPDVWVNVIVQKTLGDRSVETLVSKLGGVITKDLSLIAAFEAGMPAKAVVTLSQAPGVRWVSLDTPDVSGEAQIPAVLQVHKGDSIAIASASVNAVNWNTVNANAVNWNTVNDSLVDWNEDANCWVYRGGQALSAMRVCAQ